MKLVLTVSVAAAALLLHVTISSAENPCANGPPVEKVKLALIYKSNVSN